MVVETLTLILSFGRPFRAGCGRCIRGCVGRWWPGRCVARWVPVGGRRRAAAGDGPWCRRSRRVARRWSGGRWLLTAQERDPAETRHTTALRTRITELDRKINNLVEAIENAAGDAAVLTQKLAQRSLEQRPSQNRTQTRHQETEARDSRHRRTRHTCGRNYLGAQRRRSGGAGRTLPVTGPTAHL